MSDESAMRPGVPLKRAAGKLGASHRLAAGPAPPLAFLKDPDAVKDWLARALTAAREDEPENLAAAGWLLDNDYLVRRALRQIRTDMPADFYRRLPALAASGDEGASTGPPRVHALAHALLQISQMQLSLSVCTRFINAYQESSTLHIGELWAFPTMLRLACIEDLVAAFGKLHPGLRPPLAGTPQGVLPKWLDPADCVARALANLAVISAIDWKDFFDATSRVEKILRTDPAGVYPRMDFASRDSLRKTIEDLSLRSDAAEWQVSETLVALCETRRDDPLKAHVGWWLADDGRRDFERRIEARCPLPLRLRRMAWRHVGPVYAGAVALAWAAALALPMLYVASAGADAGMMVLTALLAVLPASVLGLTLVNWLATLMVAPRALPKLDFRDAIAPDCRTAVALPVLVARAGDVPVLARQLEAHRLANPDPMLEYVLLSDHVDAETESLPEDAEIAAALVAAINSLNDRYGDDKGGGRFHLLHRPREYNPVERCWMGRERKRGKLAQLDALILNGDRTPFSHIAGKVRALRKVRFVVTVDADTRLPTGSVNRLVGTLAHPLNSARFDPAGGRVHAGHTILQPRVEIAPEDSTRSLFARFYAGDTAIDIYSRAVSDVYQDLFGEGTFTGKGIYEVATFERSLEGRVPDNRILSHDLFEGLHGRVGLTSDIVVYEGFPSGYPEQAARMHRWVRGDWQLLPWLGRHVPGRQGERLRNRFSTLGRWKIFDNLRRSLIPAGLVALISVGWTVLPGSPWVWTVLAVLVPGAHLFTDLVTGLARGRRRGAIRGAVLRLREHAGRWGLSVIFLIGDAAIALDAIARTLWRLAAHRNMLEWVSAAQASARLAGVDPRRAAWKSMWPSPAFAALAGPAVALLEPAALTAAAPLLVLWLLAPEIAWRVGRPPAGEDRRLSPADTAFLRRIARRSWLFFETFVRPEDHWLPPDNYQETPQTGIVHRTSPTNIGMMFLSSLTAWRLGFVGLPELVERTRNTLDTMDRMQTWRGHILNWYETRHLEPLEPRYISTVDSGNLAVSLIALRQGFLEARRGAAFSAVQWDGLHDTLGLLAEAVAAAGDAAVFSPGCPAVVHDMEAEIARARDDPDEWAGALERLCDKMQPALETCIRDVVADDVAAPVESLREVHIWLERTRHHLAGLHRDFAALHGWRRLAEQPPRGCEERGREVMDCLPFDLAPQVAGEAFAEARERLLRHGALLESPAARDWIESFGSALERAARAHADLDRWLWFVAERARARAYGMDFRMLHDPTTRLFFIGYNVSFSRMDANRYDLLASEARLASLFAIAKGDVRPEHWFHLGRPVTGKGTGLALVSWNGSMFEYLMPRLLMRSHPATLLGQSDRTAVELQRAYGDRLGIPWGISESGYAAQDPEQKYRYRAFGVPGLGVRRGLAEDLVVAPYASILALQVLPHAAIGNLRRLAEAGAVGRYGFFEAVDFTPDRVPVGESFTLVRSWMSHHHGMSLAALGNVLCDDMLVKWFHADPHVRTMELLLNERVPWELPGEEAREEELLPPSETGIEAVPGLHPWSPDVVDGFAQLHAIGNRSMTARVTSDAGGSLWWHGHVLTRALGAVRGEGAGGHSIFVKDMEDGCLWSMGEHACETPGGDPWRVVFHQHLAEFHHREHGIAISVLVGVAPGADLEIRRISVINETDRARRLSLTSCAEVVLAAAADHDRHPAFSRLFVASAFLPELDALMFTRRGRDPAERHPVLLHRMVCDDPAVEIAGFETDRRAFLGRHGEACAPDGLLGEGPGGGTGWTLDPVVALEAGIALAPHGHCELAFVSVAAENRAGATDIAARFASLTTLDWALDAAREQAARTAWQRGLRPCDLPEAQSLLSALLLPVADRSAEAAARFDKGAPSQADLWTLGISGDDPILAVRAGEGHRGERLAMLLAAHRLWRDSGAKCDLVLLHDGIGGYLEPVRERLLDLMRGAGALELMGHHGGVHLVANDPANRHPADVVEAAATVLLDAGEEPLAERLRRLRLMPPAPPDFEPSGDPGPLADVALPSAADRILDNGFGGFSPHEGEYVIDIGTAGPPPAPWANVLANPSFGSIVTEAGLGWSWAVNSGENRLTPWRNDPVADPQVEALYLRDEMTGEVWTPTPLPAGRGGACRVRHGTGYTVWERAAEGLEQEVLAFVAVSDPVKLVRLRLRNPGTGTRSITATCFAEWSLAAVHGQPAPPLLATYDAGSHALIARNSRNTDFADHVAFLTGDRSPHSLTCSRSVFLGPRGDMARPDALGRWNLGECLNTAGDACAAYQVHLDIGPGESVETVFVLGQGRSRDAARTLALRWRDKDRVQEEFTRLREDWTRRLGAVQVSTPEPAFDMMVNRWLPCQTVGSRLHARAGFYQAGGAFGFRDQLQDVLALLYAEPETARAHILRAAAFQFEEGDVLHWWHPPGGSGVRTRCSDDLLWLPHVTAAYVEATGDGAVLAEEIPFLSAPPLADKEHDRYARFDRTSEAWPLFDHCERALEHAHKLGADGLPLMKDGDWNDGMNRIGARGEGQSVWLAWFMIATIRGFLKLCEDCGRDELAVRWRDRMDALARAANEAGWDGDWYLRALDDDGRPWGSSENDECRIDSISQSWAVLSEAGEPDRARLGMEAAARHLMRDDDRLVRLLTPAFDATPRDPGYIKAYPPGIRENGGQYSHAAAWLGIAFAKLGDGNRAKEVFDRLNPALHSASQEDALHYMTEPYAMAADIGGVPPHLGRGGWTWYTGAAAWGWRLAVEHILGLQLRDGALVLDPCLPEGWTGFSAKLTREKGAIAIVVENPDGVARGRMEIVVNGTPAKGLAIAFPEDGSVTEVHVRLRAASRASTGAGRTGL